MRLATTLGLATFVSASVLACSEKKPPQPAPAAPVEVSALSTAESVVTRLAHERGHLAHDPHATLADASAIVWVHDALIVRPLTGALIAVAEDIRVPGLELGLARLLSHTPSAALTTARKVAPMTWDEHLGLGPESARCALGAACDVEGRVHGWIEGGQLLSVAWEGPHPRTISAGGSPVAELRYSDSGIVEARSAALGTRTASDAWPWRVSYTRGASGRIEAVESAHGKLGYRYDDAGRLVEIARGKAVTRIEYDDEHRVTLLAGPGALTTRLTYARTLEPGQRADVVVSDALGETTRFSWSAPSPAGTSEVLAARPEQPARALRWRFDAAGRLREHTAAGATTRFAYDEGGRLVEVRHSDGLVQTLERGGDGRLARISEGPRAVAFTLTASGDIATITAGDRDRETWTWESTPGSAPRLSRIDHGAGRFEAFAYDSAGRMTRVENSEGAVDEVRYDAASGLIAMTRDELGAEHGYTYDALARPTAMTRADGSVERWSWDLDGRLGTHVAPDGRASRFEYDELGRAVRITRDDEVITRTHDALGRPLAETTMLGSARYTWRGADLVGLALPDGTALTRELDGWGRVVRERTSDGALRELVWASPETGGALLRELVPGRGERRFSWDASGRLARMEELGVAPGSTRDLRVTHSVHGAFEVKDAISGAVWSYRRTAAGMTLLASASAPSGVAESYSYDARGRLVEKVSSLGTGFSLSYDALGRPVKSVSGAGELRVSWTPGGRLASLDDAGRSRHFDYDGAGRVTGVSEGASRWRFGYGPGPDPTELVDPAGRRTLLAYDPYQRLVSRIAPASGTDRFGYDSAGRLVSETRADGTTHGYTWDELGRLARHDVDGIANRTLSWDGRGRLVRDTGQSHALDVVFDDARKTRTVTDLARSIATSRTRDALGHTELLEVDGQLRARYLRRADGLLTRVEATGGFAIELEHDSFGRRKGLRFPGGGALRYTFDAARRLTGLELSSKSGATWSARFTYDGAGRLASQSNGARTLGYAYDDRGRLVTLTLPDGARREYRWNDAGDLVRMGALDLRPDTAGRATAGGRAYDAAGRMTARADGQSLAYDRAGHLAAVQRSEARVAFTYDGDGRLLGRSASGATTDQLVWDGDDLVELRHTGSTTPHVPGELPGERFGFVADGAPRYLVQGPDGSTLAVVDGQGELLMTYLHEPFGQTLVAEGSAPDVLHYRARFIDPVSGLVHFPMRWYDPEVGAFVAPDPDAGDLMQPATLHRYAYLLGDPVNNADPLGADAYQWGPETCLEAVCKLFGSDKIKAVTTVGDGYSYVGAIDKRGWVYDIWAKRVPGTDRVLTVFRDLNERAEGLTGGGAGIDNNIVLDPDGPRGLRLPGSRPVISATPAGPAANAPPATRPGMFTRLGSSIREGLDQFKLGVRLYGKEVTGTVTGLGGLSGTLGTSVSTLAALPGGALIIGAAGALAGAVGYGVGTVLDKLPGVSQGAQILINSVFGYPKDQLLADLKAAAENEGAKAREHREKAIADNLAKDTMPPPPDPGVAGGSVNLGDPAPRDRDRDRDRPEADAGGTPDGDDDDDDDADEDDEDDEEDARTAPAEKDTIVPDILSKVAARKITVRFKHEQDMSSGKFKNIISCNSTLTFWNVGAMAAGYGAASMKSHCESSMTGTFDDNTMSGTFSGGPNGTIVFSGEGGAAELELSYGHTIITPDGAVSLPADAFADWPKDVR